VPYPRAARCILGGAARALAPPKTQPESDCLQAREAVSTEREKSGLSQVGAWSAFVSWLGLHE